MRTKRNLSVSFEYKLKVLAARQSIRKMMFVLTISF